MKMLRLVMGLLVLLISQSNADVNIKEVNTTVKHELELDKILKISQCPLNSTKTGKRYDGPENLTDVYTGPGMTYKKVSNHKASKIFKKPIYIRVNKETTLYEECSYEDWSKVRSVKPTSYALINSHRGWIESKYIHIANQKVQINKKQTDSNLKITNPDIVCHLMKDEGMDMNSLGWKDYYGIGCYSHSKEIETNDVRMTLAYYVNGSDLDTVSDIKFMLNVFTEESDIQLVHTELLEASKLLSPHIINEQLSDEVAALILTGTPGNVVINGVNIEVLKKVWPTGKGYEIQVIFK
jgi:hypothetical protein